MREGSPSMGGLALGAAAYALWGASALYWPLLRPAGAAEIVAVRVLLSGLALALLVTVLRRWPEVRSVARDARQRRLLAAAAGLIGLNWGVFIYATLHDQVVEASLGYFVSPLVMVGLGALVFRERPRPRQWLAAALGAAGLAVLVGAHGRFPWIALTLALTFGLYAVLKKRSGVPAVEGLTVETAVLLPPALAYALVLQGTGAATFGQVSVVHTGLMAGASLVMVLPLLLFGAAANRTSLTSIGLLQYIEPVVQFLIGVVVFSESMPGPRWAAFALVWLSIVVLVSDRRRRAGAATPVTVTEPGPRR